MPADPNKNAPSNGGTAMLTSKASSVAGLLSSESFTGEIRRALARNLDPDHFLRVVLTECRQNRKLFECNPQSFAAALLEMAQLGLEPGPLGHAYLVPYGKECTLIVGYKGIIKLAWDSKQLKSIEAREVHDKDEFDFSYGTGAHIVHKPNLREDRGNAYAYWARAEFKDGGEVFAVLSRSDIEVYRKRSRAANNGPWVTDYGPMACKTVILRIKHLLPLSDARMEVLERVERYELGLADGVIDGMAEVVALDDDEQAWVDRVNGALPKEKQLSAPGQTRLREEGGFDALKAELTKRAAELGVDAETGEVVATKGKAAEKPKTEPKAEAAPATTEAPAQSQAPAEGAGDDPRAGLPGIEP